MDLGKASFTISAGVSGQEKVDRLNESLEQTGKAAGVSAKQTRIAFQQLPAQLTDVVTQLAGGQNPLLVLIQQGGQVKDSFGGIGPALKALGSALTPLRLAIGGVGAAAGLLAAGFFVSEKRAEDLSRALAVTGNNAGITRDRFEALVDTISSSSGITAGVTRELLQGAVASGAFGPRTIESVTRAMAELQRVSGRTAEEVRDDFAGMREGVTKWAEEKNRAYNFLTPEVYKQIKALELQGDREGAIVVATEAFTEAFRKRTVQLGFFSKAWKEVREAASGAWEAITGVFEGDTPEKRIAQIERELKSLEDARVKSMGSAAFSARRTAYEQALEKELAQLKATKKATEDKAAAEARAASETRKAIEAEKIRDALIGSNATRLIELQKAASEERIRALELEETGVERLRARGLIGEQEASDRILAIKRKQLDAEIEIAEARLRAESGRRIVETDPVQRAVAEAEKANRVLAAQTELAAARGKIPALLANQAVDDAERQTQQADRQFDELGRIYRTGLDEMLALQRETESARIALIRNPTERANAQVDQDIKVIQEKYQKLLDALLAARAKALALGDDEVAGTLEKRIQELRRQLEEAEEVANKGRSGRGIMGGAMDGLKDWLGAAEDVAGQVKNAVGGALDGLTDVLTEWVTTGKASFKDFARSVLAELAKIAIKMALVNAVKAGFGYAGIPIPSAKGNVFAGGSVQAFAKGGVVAGTTVFPMRNGRTGMMGEAGPEAIMPLRRTASGRLGVEVAGGGGGGGTNVQVNVNMTTGENSSQSDSNNGAQLGRNIAAAVKQVIMQEQRPGGLLYA